MSSITKTSKTSKNYQSSVQSFNRKKSSVKTKSNAKSESTTTKKQTNNAKAYTWQKPPNQLKLTASELAEDIPRVLKTNNPQPVENIIRFNYKERRFKLMQPVENLAVLFQLEGNYIHNDSLEAKLQYQRIRTDSAVRERYVRMKSLEKRSFSDDSQESQDSQKNQSRKKSKTKRSKSISVAPKVKEPSASSSARFDYNIRATQTFNNPMMHTGTMTEPPAGINFCQNATQDVIFDAYAEDYAREQMMKKLAEKRILRYDKLQKLNAKKYGVVVSEKKLHKDAEKMCIGAQIMERILSQNKYEDIIYDFKYWEDRADEYRETGNLLPLWIFKSTNRKLIVNSINWNVKYPDLFVISMGSKNYQKKNEGCIMCFSLKNPLNSDYYYETKSRCLYADFHFDQHKYIAVALYDGSVFVWNLCNHNIDSKPIIIQAAKKLCMHSEPVWQVKWDKNDANGNLTFLSLSSDGLIVKWTVLRDELQGVRLINFKEVVLTKNDELFGNLIMGSCTCIELNPQNDMLYLVGTEEGLVHRCSKGYRDKILDLYHAHTMPVYAIKWNPFYAKFFLTCSSDWMVKLWDYTVKDPLNSYDLGSAVVDVAWAPFSSTIFAALTIDGDVFVYDFTMDKYEPICKQRVIKKRKATRLQFNPKYPILIVGDNKGAVSCFKLSPNLRKTPKETIKRDVKTKESEVTKLERVLVSFFDADMIPEKTVRSLMVEKPKEKIEPTAQQGSYEDEYLKRNSIFVSDQEGQQGDDKDTEGKTESNQKEDKSEINESNDI